MADAPECGCTFAKLATEQFGHAFDRQIFGDIDVLAAAVIALARKAFGIFVGEDRTLRLEYRAADDVLRRDQFDLVALATEFEADRFGDFGIGLRQMRREQGLGRTLGLLTRRHCNLLVGPSALEKRLVSSQWQRRSRARLQPRHGMTRD